MVSSSALDALIDALKRLPGIGPRSAQRIAFHLMQHERDLAVVLGQSLLGAAERVGHCARCNSLTELEVCQTCADPRRDPALLCVVESPADQSMIEQSLAYSGCYFVLMGRLSPLDGIGPQELELGQLGQRISDGVVREVVIATSFTPEGDATAHFIGQMVKGHDATIKISRLARGVPVGGELEYTDVHTIAQAMLDRRAQ